MNQRSANMDPLNLLLGVPGGSTQSSRSRNNNNAETITQRLFPYRSMANQQAGAGLPPRPPSSSPQTERRNQPAYQSQQLPQQHYPQPSHNKTRPIDLFTGMIDMAMDKASEVRTVQQLKDRKARLQNKINDLSATDVYKDQSSEFLIMIFFIGLMISLGSYFRAIF